MANNVLLGLLLMTQVIAVQGITSCQNNTFTMTFTNVVELKSSTFASCTGVTHVNISNNQIASIANGAFKYLWRVKVLDISNNKLSHLENDTFSSLTRLEYLYITNNKLTTIPLGFFDGKLSLIKVDLSYNKINNIPVPVFDKPLPAIKEVILQHNEMTAYEPYALAYEITRQSIKYIDLKYNKISEFRNTANWTYDGRSLYAASLTDLRFNNLTGINEAFYNQYNAPGRQVEVSTIMAEVMVDIRNNSIVCDCSLYPLAKSARNSYFLWSQNDLLKIMCHNPPELRDKLAFYDVRLTEFVCNVTQSCPTGCLCQERPHDGVIHVDCKNASLDAIPDALPYNEEYPAYELIVNFNQITRIENVSYATEITVLQAANNMITYISEEFIAKMAEKETVKISLQNNRLTRVPETMENIKYQNVQLEGNNLVCDCDMLWMKQWINLAPKFIKKDLSCTFEGEIHKIVDLDEDILECSNVGNIIMIVLLSVGLAIAIALIVTAKRCPYATKVVIFKIFRIHPADNYKIDDLDKDYDAYIAYDEDDTYVRQWVQKRLIQQLEVKKPNYKLFIGARNMKPGVEAEVRIEAMENSRRLIIVLSENFDKKRWCDYEACQAETLDHNDGRVMFILYDKKGEDLIMQEPWLSKSKDRKLFRLNERMFWSKVRYEMPRAAVKPKPKVDNGRQGGNDAHEMTDISVIS